MSSRVSPQGPGSSASNKRSSSMPPVARVETSSSQGSHAEQIAELRKYWDNQDFNPDQTLYPSHFTAHTSGPQKYAAASSPRQAPERTPRQYGGVSTGSKFDPRRPSPERNRNGLEEIHRQFGGPSRQGSGDTSAATIASLSKPSQTRNSSPPTAVTVARGTSPAPQIQDFQKRFMVPSTHPNTAETSRRPTVLPQPAIPSRTVSANNAQQARPGVAPHYREQAPHGGRLDGRGRGQSSTNLQPPQLGPRSKSANSTFGSARRLGHEFLDTGLDVWDRGLFNVFSGRQSESGGSSRNSSRGRR